MVAGVCCLAAAHGTPLAAGPRAVALAPHITELVFAAGAGDRLVGTVQGSDFPPAARQIANIGDGTRLGAEALLSLRPQLVIGWQPAALRSLLPLLQSREIGVVYSDPRRLQDIAPEIERLGALLGTADHARARAAPLREQVDALQARYASALPVRVFVQVGLSPMYSVNAQSIITDALHTCGAVNVMAASNMSAPLTSVEGVLSTQPDVILAGVSSPPARQVLLDFWRTRGWPRSRQGTATDATTKAVANANADAKADADADAYAGLKADADADADARIITLDADALYRATPRMIEATAQLCLRLDRVRAMMQDDQKRNGTITHDH